MRLAQTEPWNYPEMDMTCLHITKNGRYINWENVLAWLTEKKPYWTQDPSERLATLSEIQQ